MGPDDPVARLIERIADGQPIDWPAVRREIGDAAGLLRGLEIIGGVAQLYGSAAPLLPGQATVITPAAPAAPPPAAPPQSPSDASTRNVTRTWGKYLLLDKLGEGSFGSVYHARDPQLDLDVAIKILHKDSVDAEVRQRLLSEGRVLARILHPNVVRVFGAESHNDDVGLVMEFVQGETLEAVLARHGTLSAREVTPIAEDVCSALAAVHKAGFLHRDVKTKNVMRDTAGRIVLMDFGTGRDAEEAARAGWADVAGTPIYMAPEVLRGDAATPCSDVYSVGVLLYHLLTAEYPVDGRDVEEIILNHRHGRQRLLSDRRPDLPAGFTQVVTKAIALDSRQRYPTPGALRDALRQASEQSLRLDLYLRPVGIAGAVATFLIALGMLSTLTFNVSLGRSGFVSESLWDSLYWGARSCVGPLFSTLMGFAALTLLGVVRRLLTTVSTTLNEADAALAYRLKLAARRMHFDDLSVVASCALLLCASAVIVACWYFQPLLLAFTMNATTAPRSVLALLAPGPDGVPNDIHVNYRITFTWIAIISTLAWYLIWRRSVHTHQPLQTSVLAGGLGVVVFALALVDYPFRLFYHNQFEVVALQGETCYELARRADDVLLFCPMSVPPRTRTASDGELQRSGRRESVFTLFRR